ncbi:MAG: hypothetical protein NVS2B8_18510 [Vulcanimicrobiaceae bacterium]
MVAVILAAALAPPDRKCERPAYVYEHRAMAAENVYRLADVSRERERAAAVYLRCRPTAPRPEREAALAGIDLATAATFAWLIHDRERGCGLMRRAITLVMSADASGRLSSFERKHTSDVLDEFKHDLRDGRARWFRDKHRHPCSFDEEFAHKFR